jgi:transcription initiation factor TFIIB
MITTNIERCFLCKSENSIKTDFTYGQVACTNCGAVLDDRIIDETSEWRNFSSENPGSSSSDPNRVGGPINPYMDEINLSTTIHTNKRNGVLSKWKHRSLGSGGRSLSRIFKRVEELAAKLDLPLSIIEKSKDLLILVEKSKKLKGRSLDCIIASVYFAACRRCNAPRTLRDITQSLQLEKKDVSRCFNSIKMIIADTDGNRITYNTLGLVNKYCTKLEIPHNIKKAAYEITEEVCKKEIIAGRNPSTVATASIYFALKLFGDAKISKRDIADQSKITENTINSAYQQLVLNKDIITPPHFQDKLKNLEPTVNMQN